MDNLQIMVVNTALKDMLKRGYLSISTIREILEVTGGVPRAEDLRLLSLLHCVHFNEMPPELLRGLPVLLERVIGSEGLEFDYKQYSKHLHLAA